MRSLGLGSGSCLSLTDPDPISALATFEDAQVADAENEKMPPPGASSRRRGSVSQEVLSRIATL